jgi:hypothetical protein
MDCPLGIARWLGLKVDVYPSVRVLCKKTVKSSLAILFLLWGNIFVFCLNQKIDLNLTNLLSPNHLHM